MGNINNSSCCFSSSSSGSSNNNNSNTSNNNANNNINNNTDKTTTTKTTVTKKLHNISVVFNQKRMCSICSTNVTKNLRSTHTKKLKAKYFTTDPTLKIGCEMLRSQTKDLLKFSRTSLCNEAISFKTKDW